METDPGRSRVAAIREAAREVVMVKTAGLWVVLSAVAGGCGLVRGIPTHGGGKRFDEEQRIVACAIRSALAEMDLTEVRGKRVQIVTECLGHEGGGNMTFPGLSYANVSGSMGRNKEAPYSPYSPRYVDTGSISGSIGVQPRAGYGGGASTGGDVNYLRSVLEMMLRLDGGMPGGDKPDATLVVLVDVLGVNRSRNEQVFRYTEDYQASCEITYYALAPDGKVLFPPRQVGARSLYRERHDLGRCRVSRATWPAAPTVRPMPPRPAGPPQAPTSQPTAPVVPQG